MVVSIFNFSWREKKQLPQDASGGKVLAFTEIRLVFCHPEYFQKPVSLEKKIS